MFVHETIMKQFSFFLPVLICLIACNSKPKNNCKPYFEFDELEHYSITTTLEVERRLSIRDSLSPLELKLNDVLLQPKRAKLADTVNLLNLEAIGFKKQSIPASKFNSINQFFCEKNYEELVSTACIPVYRDVLIFKRQNKIIGTAKICFDCGYHVIAGAKVNTDAFGQYGDYEKLQKLLYQNSKTMIK